MSINKEKARELVRKFFPRPISLVMIDPYLESAVESTIPRFDTIISGLDTDEKLVQFLDTIINGEAYYEIIRPVQDVLYGERGTYSYKFIGNELDTSLDPPAIVRKEQTYSLNKPEYTSIPKYLDVRSMLSTVKMIYILTDETLHTRCPEFKVLHDLIDGMIECDRIVQLKHRADSERYFQLLQQDYLEDIRMVSESVSKSTLGIFMANNVSIAKSILSRIDQESLSPSSLFQGLVDIPTEDERIADPQVVTDRMSVLWLSILHTGLFSMIAFHAVNYFHTMDKSYLMKR